MANLIVLYRLQQADKQIDEIERELLALEGVLPGQEELESARKAYEESRSRKREADRKLKDAELELASLESEKKRVEEKLYGGKVTNAKELSQLEKDLDQLVKRREKLDERVLMGMEAVEKSDRELSGTESAFRGVEARAEGTRRALAERQERLRRQLEDLKARRQQLAESLESPLLEQYRGLRERKGGVAVVKLQKNSCGGCFMLVPESSIQKVRVLELETCSSCGRILYLDKEV